MKSSAARMLAQLDAWRRDLIDFSRRNRLLNMSGRGTVIELIEPSSEIIVSRLLNLMALRVMSKSENDESEDEEVDPASAKDAKNESSKELARGLTDGEIVELLETQVRSSVGDSSKLASSLRALRRRADQEFLDKGIRILYLAVGELHWEEREEEWVSPILMLPIILERVSGLHSPVNIRHVRSLNSRRRSRYSPPRIPRPTGHGGCRPRCHGVREWRHWSWGGITHAGDASITADARASAAHLQ